MAKKNKTTKGIVLELDNSDRGNLIEIQSRFVRTGVRKTLVQIASDCLKIGIADKLIDTEKL
ncbi:MAG TPA: hypothetical protein VI911_00190 [Patescibacteria group bacterium]|nr:hypothetical protein [Patescibacteria group bacterium]